MKQKKSDKIFKIGLTGSIGMGKTTVANMFRDIGIPVSCADTDVASAVSVGGEAVEQIAKIFPKALKYNDKKQPYIDKSKLAKIIFSEDKNLKKLKKLEEILHPIAKNKRFEFTQNIAKKGCDIILYDIPLLFENNIDKEVDLTICVSCPEDIQKKRVLARENMTEKKFNAIKTKQMPNSKKIQLADIVIDTSKSLTDTKKQVNKIVEQIKSGKILNN